MADRTLSRRRRSSSIERARCRGLLTLSRPLHFSRRVHQHGMWNFHRRCGKVELRRPADEQVWIGQRRWSDAGGNVGRPTLARARFVLRSLLAWLVQSLVRDLALDISLPPHHDYRPSALVRLRGYKWLVDTCAIMMWGLCLQRRPARRFRGQRPAPLYFLTSPPALK